MKITKKFVSYILVFLMVFSSFTILPSEFWGLADVSAVELSTEESTAVETYTDEIATEEPITVENNKDEITIAQSNAVETYTEGDFTYTIINDEEVELVGYKGTSLSIVIPDVTTGSECSALANKKVTSIGEKAFYKLNLTSIKFGKNITYIDKYAFYYNESVTKLDLSVCKELKTIAYAAFGGNSALESVIFPDSLEIIEQSVFSRCTSLVKVETGSNLIELGASAFYGCESLKTVTLNGGNNATIGVFAFDSCSELESMTIGDGVKVINTKAFIKCRKLKKLELGKRVSVDGSSQGGSLLVSNLETIDKFAFQFCDALEEVIIPDSVKYIGESAFADMISLKKVTIGSGCTSITPSMFSGDKLLESITVSPENTKYLSYNGVVLDKSKETILLYPKARSGQYKTPDTVTTIGDEAFKECNNLTQVVIGDNVTSIGNNAFNCCKELTKVVIGNGVTTIGDGAFYDNDELTTVNLPDNLEVIGKEAFRYCEKLYTIETGSNLKNINNYAFSDCDGLKTVNLKGGNDVTIGEYAFYSCDGMKNLTIGDGTKTIKTEAFSKCINLENVEIGDTLTAITDSIFSYNEALKTVTIGSGCTYINSYAFFNNYALESIIVSPDNPVYTSDNGVLMDKDKKIIWIFPKARGGAYTTPENVKAIGECAFFQCVNLTEVVISDNVTVIGRNAFYTCSNLRKVVIGDNVLAIREGAFLHCQRLTDISFGEGLLCIDDNIFHLNRSLKEIDLSKCTKLTDIGEYVFYGNELTTVKLPNSLKTIGDYAFDECKYLQEVTLGENITYIGNEAFDNCNSLTKIQIFSNELVAIFGSSIPKSTTIYCYKNSTTHNTLINKGYTKIKSIASSVPLVDIKINGVSVNEFNTNTKNYTVYVNDITNVDIKPVFEKPYANYTVTNENNIYAINVFDENNEIINTYKVTVEEYDYTVTGDVSLMLNNISSTKVGGSIALPAGTYKLKIAKGATQFGYNKIVTDYCNSLTLSEKYSSYITLNATGGTYTFQFDKNTNKLIIKHDKNLPNEYLIGDIDTILKPVEDRPLSIGTQQLQAGTYKFKLSIGGKEYGYNKIVDDATTGSLSMNSKYTAQVTLNATGGMYTFVLNTETNKLIIRHTPTDKEDTTDVHISGTFNLVLNDKSATGEDLTTATGTTTLTNGCYTFKVYNYGTVYTANAVINDKANKNLSNKYTTPVTLNATGGTYKFTFNKETGALIVSKL